MDRETQIKLHKLHNWNMLDFKSLKIYNIRLRNVASNILQQSWLTTHTNTHRERES